MSNLKSHIINCLKSQQFDKDNNDDQESNSSKKKSIQLNSTNGHLNGITVDLNITPIDNEEDMQNHLEDQIGNQIAIQLVHMSNTVYQCNDTQQTMKCNFGTKSSSIKMCDVPSDGDCFFSVASHQSTYVKINSIEHKTDTENLRKATVNYIEQNLQDYKHNLKNRLIEFGYKIDENNLDVQCLQFVKDHLAKAGTFAGRESFEAISAIKKVNIVVFNEKGTCYFGANFDPTHKKTILVAFRGSTNGQQNKDRDHFGSITEIQSKLVKIASQHLIKNHMQYIRNKNRNSVVIIE